MCAAALAELTQLLVEGGLPLPVWGLVGKTVERRILLRMDLVPKIVKTSLCTDPLLVHPGRSVSSKC